MQATLKRSKMAASNEHEAGLQLIFAYMHQPAPHRVSRCILKVKQLCYSWLSIRESWDHGTYSCNLHGQLQFADGPKLDLFLEQSGDFLNQVITKSRKCL